MVDKERPPEDRDQDMAEGEDVEDEAPEDDFFEADASAELTDDDGDQATVEFNSDDEDVSSTPL